MAPLLLRWRNELQLLATLDHPNRIPAAPRRVPTNIRSQTGQARQEAAVNAEAATAPQMRGKVIY